MIDKRRMAYRTLVAALPALMKEPRRVAALPELGRFIGKVERRHHEVLRAARLGRR